MQDQQQLAANRMACKSKLSLSKVLEQKGKLCKIGKGGKAWAEG